MEISIFFVYVDGEKFNYLLMNVVVTAVKQGLRAKQEVDNGKAMETCTSSSPPSLSLSLLGVSLSQFSHLLSNATHITHVSLTWQHTSFMMTRKLIFSRMFVTFNYTDELRPCGNWQLIAKTVYSVPIP